MKKLLLSLGLALTLTMPVFAKVNVSSQAIILDGKEIPTKGYIINNSNYFKLRDIAALLSEGEASFSINYNSTKNAIEISRDGTYKKGENDLNALENSDSNPKKSSQRVFVDGEEVQFDAYNIDDFNYFKLRDLGRVIGFYVDFDKEKGDVIIKSEKLPPLPLVNNQEKIKITDLSTRIKTTGSKMTLKEKSKVKINDFFDNIENIIVGTQDQGQLTASQEYIEDSNLVIVKPVMKKYQGSINYKPIIQIDQDGKREFFPYEGEIDLEKILVQKSFDKKKSFTIYLGHYVGEEIPQNFRKLSTISYN
ncbi:hypothetical protein [Peptoniphilus raoultii]|uniref:hypothetical protein n=1 Tax=Peptoniphilus raoultii TaxID=1776387 RepID=UPI0008DB1113|nr:hypothetical protein [Peptoniphilus raoultii]